MRLVHRTAKGEGRLNALTNEQGEHERVGMVVEEKGVGEYEAAREGSSPSGWANSVRM